MSRIFIMEGVDARTLGNIFLVVVQSFLLYGSEIWVLMPRIKRVLGGFHHRVDCSPIGLRPQKGKYGVCVYPPLEDAMAEVGLQEVETYVSRFQNTVAQYFVTMPIMDLCMASERIPGTRVEMRWWEQESLDLEGMQTTTWEAEDMEGGE